MKKSRISKFERELKEAQKDPNFIKEVNKFIKAATSVYKLH